MTSCMNSKPPLQHSLALEVVDQNGNNVLQNIKQGDIDGSSYEVEGSSYRQAITNGSYGNVNYLIIHSMGGFDEYDTHLTWKLKCKEVFGNDEPHALSSQWTKEASFSLRCVSFEFEGKTYTPQLKNGYWTARVVVNR